MVFLAILQGGQRRPSAQAVQRHVQFTIDSCQRQAKRKHGPGGDGRIGLPVVTVILERQLDGVSQACVEVRGHGRGVMGSHLRCWQREIINSHLIVGVISAGAFAVVRSDIDDIVPFGSGRGQVLGGRARLIQSAVDIDRCVVVGARRVPGRYDVVRQIELQQRYAVQPYRRIVVAEMLPHRPLLTGAGAEFVKKYREKYNKEPEAYAVYGYEAAKVFLRCVRLYLDTIAEVLVHMST